MYSHRVTKTFLTQIGYHIFLPMMLRYKDYMYMHGVVCVSCSENIFRLVCFLLSFVL